MAKPIQYCKVINLQLKKKKKKTTTAFNSQQTTHEETQSGTKATPQKWMPYKDSIQT